MFKTPLSVLPALGSLFDYIGGRHREHRQEKDWGDRRFVESMIGNPSLVSSHEQQQQPP